MLPSPPPTEAGSSASNSPVLSQISDTRVGVKQSGRALLLCPAQGGTVDSCARKLCVPTWEAWLRSFIAVVQEWGCC